MKKIIIFLSAALMFASCQESLEDRAARELKEYTEKNCPTPVVDDQRIDSLTFERESRTIRYYYTLYNKADNAELLAKNRKGLRQTILKTLRADTHTKNYKDAGFVFRYTYHSASAPGKTLLDETFTKKDYK